MNAEDIQAQARLFALVAEMYAINTAVAGMQAENHHRLYCGNSIAYGEEAFSAQADRLNEIAKLMCTTV